jgi:hypothetical protein
LEARRNPFAVVVMAHLKTQETKKDSARRKVWKFTLVKRLYELGYSRSDVLNLFKFVDWAMILPEGLKRAFWEELKAYEEERQMPYVTSVEQIGYDRGLQDGEETGVEKERRSLALKMLQENIQIETIARITGFAIEQIQELQAEVQ